MKTYIGDWNRKPLIPLSRKKKVEHRCQTILGIHSYQTIHPTIGHFPSICLPYPHQIDIGNTIDHSSGQPVDRISETSKEPSSAYEQGPNITSAVDSSSI